jgi:hypothetical protein
MTQIIDILRKELNAKTMIDALCDADHTQEPNGQVDLAHVAQCLIDRLMQELHCGDCDGTGEVRDPDNTDAQPDGDGSWTYCGGHINCPTCKGSGMAFDVSPAIAIECKGEDHHAIGVQAAMPLSSYPSRGTATTSPSGAEAPALSSDVASIVDALKILEGPMSETAGKDSAAFGILFRAAVRLREDQRSLLTTEVGQ